VADGERRGSGASADCLRANLDTMVPPHEASQPTSHMRLGLERDHARPERRERHRAVPEVGAYVEDQIARAHERRVEPP
jgi:hypothetical protein